MFLATHGDAVAFTISAGPSYTHGRNGYVGLTFDDGPYPATTTALLDALDAAGLRATMFNTGRNAAGDPGLARAQVDAGMWIANHSWSHPHMTGLSPEEMASEVSRTQDAIERATGVTPKLFRPPYGETDAALREVADRFGLTEVLWDVDPQDWNGASTEEIVAAAATLQDGQVILLHDNYQATIDAIPRIAADLAERGLGAGMISPDTGRAVAPQ